MDLVPLKNNIFHDVRLNEIITKTVERLGELKLIDKKYLSDGEFILYLMNLVEHLVDKKDKIDKKKLLLDLFKNHYGATDADLQLIDRMIEFLHTNHKVKKVSYYKMFKAGLTEWFRKK